MYLSGRLTLKNKHNQKGFTIVELLIVVVVIAILAAITIVAYNGIQNRAKDSALQSKASQIGKKALAYAPLNADLYPPAATFEADLALPPSDAQSVYDYYVSDDQRNFCLSVTNTQTSPVSSYAVTSKNGSAVKGRCVMNLIRNPSFEIGVPGWAGSGVTASQSTIGVDNGADSVKLTPSVATVDTFAFVSLNTGSSPTLVELNQPYTLSGVVYQAGAQTGTLDNRARRILVYSWAGTTSGLGAGSTAGANTAGSSRQTVNFTVVQAGATRIDMRLYSGASNSADNSVYWDSIMLTKGTGTYSYGDGDSAGWSWTGTAHNSPSFGPAILQ